MNSNSTNSNGPANGGPERTAVASSRAEEFRAALDCYMADYKSSMAEYKRPQSVEVGIKRRDAFYGDKPLAAGS